jgi:hypothetical protein
MRMFAVALILLWLTSTVNAQIPHDSQVRSSSSYLRDLLAQGYAKSVTFRHLIVRLNESDVVVYIEPHLTMQSSRSGHLTSRVVIGGSKRYLRIRVNPRGRPNTMIARLAHELQHALEVADAPAVRDEVTFEKHFMLIDSGTCRGACFETIAARETQLVVAKELRAR